MKKLEESCEWYGTSVALMKGRIRTKTDADRDAEKLLRDIKMRNIYLHLNPFNYFKEEKPFGWYDFIRKNKNDKGIPLDIKLLSVVYPIIDYKKKYGEEVENLAKGEIEKINFTKGLKGMMKIGEYANKHVTENGDEYSTGWVHLGRDYFKQISKVLDNRTC